MNLSGEIELQSKYYKAGTPIAYWQLDSWLVDIDRGFIYYIQSRNQLVSVLITRYDLNMENGVTWDSTTKGFKSGNKETIFSFSDDKTKIIGTFILDSDPTNVARFGYVDIDFDDFTDSNINVYSDSNVFANGFTLSFTSFLESNTLLYSESRNRNQIFFKTYNINTDAITSIGSGINGLVVDYRYEQRKKRMHCLINLKNTTLIQYVIYDHNTTSVIHTSNTYETGTVTPVGNVNTRAGAFLLSYNSLILEIAYYKPGDNQPSICKFDTNMNLLNGSCKNSNNGTSLFRNQVIKRVKNKEIYHWNYNTFRKMVFQQSTVDKPILSGDVLSGSQINNSVPLL